MGGSSSKEDFRLSIASKVTKANQELLRKSANNTLTGRDLQNHLDFLERERVWLEKKYAESDEEQKRQYLLRMEADESVRNKALIEMQTCTDVKQRAADCLFFIKDAQRNAINSKAYRKCVAWSKRETKSAETQSENPVENGEGVFAGTDAPILIRNARWFYCFILLPLAGCWVGMHMFEEQSTFWLLSSVIFFLHICCMAGSPSSQCPRIHKKGEHVGTYQMLVDLIVNT
jgi:hypothetical protein